MTSTFDLLKEQLEALRNEAEHLAQEQARIVEERRQVAQARKRTQVALEEVAKLEGLGEPDPPHVPASTPRITPKAALGTIADACDAALQSLGGEAEAKDIFRVLLASKRLVKLPGDTGQAYTAMAGCLRKNPKRFARAGRARWKLVPRS